MVDYSEHIGRQVELSGTVVIKGYPLDIGTDHPLKTKGFMPIVFPSCVCVTEPCDCDHDEQEVIVWLPEAYVRSRDATEEKADNGEALFAYRVANEAHVMTEIFARRKVTDLALRGSRTRLPVAGAHVFAAEGIKTGKKPDKTLASRSVVCAGNTLYYVVEGPDGNGGTMFEYIAIGSCETLSS